MEIEEGDEVNDDVNEEKIIEDNEWGTIYSYVTKEYEWNKDKKQVTKKVMKWVIIVWKGSLKTSMV